jgi:hypothetical protein
LIDGIQVMVQFASLMGSNGINIALTGTQLVLVFMLIIAYMKTQELWRWHKPITTETGDYFPWKIDQSFFAKIDDLVGAVEKMAERDVTSSERIDLLLSAIERQGDTIRDFDDKWNQMHWAQHHPEAADSKRGT